MECSTPRYKVLQRDSIGVTVDLSLTAEPNYDNGYMLLSLQSLASGGENATLTGAFEISRQNMRNPKHWEVIAVFILQNEVISRSQWKDFTVQHGEVYRYSARQFNEAGVYSDRVISNEVMADFEDAYLFDGERQLKIKYNPKVSNFKNDILESKTDTIGSKYPFIFRNGHVNYKEFPISGLISYWMDDEELFTTLEDIGIDDVTNVARAMTVKNNIGIGRVKYLYDYDDGSITITDRFNNPVEEDPNDTLAPVQKEDLITAYKENRKYAVENFLSKNYKTTDLVNYNIAAERTFKLEVLEWLTNGKPKLFRSPAEGNYIVRLLNTNLTPTDTVGRMLHTFSCTAYEIADNNYENLVALGFIDNSLDEKEKNKTYYRTVPLGWQGHMNDGYSITTDTEPQEYKNYYYYDTINKRYVFLDEEALGENYLETFALYREKNLLYETNYIPIISGYNPNYLADDFGMIELLSNPNTTAHEPLHALSIAFDDMASNDVIWINEERFVIGNTGQYLLDKAENIYSVKVMALGTEADKERWLANLDKKLQDMVKEKRDELSLQYWADFDPATATSATMERLLEEYQADLRDQFDPLYRLISFNRSYDKNRILNDYDGTFTYEYIDEYTNSFDLIANQTLVDYPCRQFVDVDEDKNIIDEITDVRTELINVLQISAELKQVEDIYTWQYNAGEGMEIAVPFSISPNEFHNYFSFDRTKAPNSDTGNSGRERDGQVFDGQKNNAVYIYHILPIFKHQELIDEAEIPVAYQALPEWERYTDFNTSGDDPSGSHEADDDGIFVQRKVWIYDYTQKKWVSRDMVYHKNENYYVDVLRYNETGEYYKYYNFKDGDYYLIYSPKEDLFKVIRNFSTKLWINTGVTSGTFINENGELCAKDGTVLQPYIDLATTGTFKTEIMPEITDIYVGSGVILNLSYQVREVEYSIESTNPKLANLKQTWQTALNNYIKEYYERKPYTTLEEYNFKDETWKSRLDNNSADNLAAMNAMNYENIQNAYNNYVAYLDDRLRAYREEHGFV